MYECDDIDDDDDDVAPLLVPVHETIGGDGGLADAQQQQQPVAAQQMESSRLPSTKMSLSSELQQVLPSESPSLQPCPVTILSGFLGAGKTTLVQYILQSPDHGKRIAVIENEYGGSNDNNSVNNFNNNSNAALSIESIIARDGLTSDSLQDLIELPNGCTCCTVKDSLILTLEQLLNKRSDLDYILIECSGMANPGPIAAMFWLDAALESRLRLDGIVTVVDAVNIEHQLREAIEASQQIAYADRILLNKVDLLENISEDMDASVARLSNMIHQIHPTAAIRSTSFSAVPDLDWMPDVSM
jgi:G3E family GTPase